MQVITTMTGLAAVESKLSRWAAKMPEATAQAMYTSSQHVLVPAIKRKLRENKSIFRGQLHQRIGTRFRAMLKGGEVAIDVGALMVPYGLHVEQGWKPGEETVDYGKILQYVRKKIFSEGGAVKHLGKGGKERAESLAWAIYDTLVREGAKFHPFVMPAWDRKRDEWLEDVILRLRTRLGAI